jgi:hypothetical protein
MKISNDTIENRTRDLPACSTVPQPTAPPLSPHLMSTEVISPEVKRARREADHCIIPRLRMSGAIPAIVRFACASLLYGAVTRLVLLNVCY